jgi:sporulation protein YlmC with PRC-barrel domain
MLRSMKDMEDYTIGATDGVIGRVRDFYFDDEAWVIRYLVVETGEGSAQRRVLISPIGIGQPNWSEKILPVSLTCAQVKRSPDIDTDKPVSRQHEMGYLGYYGYGAYWGGGGLWGAGVYPDELQAGLQKEVASTDPRHQGDDVHLRSGNEIMRYYVHASDGDIGHVQGLVVDEKSWAIRYIIVNTSNWWMGHKVLISPEWIDDVDWPESKLSIDLTRQAVKDSPPYDPNAPLSLQQEAGIHAHYGRANYSPLKSRRPPGQARL